MTLLEIYTMTKAFEAAVNHAMLYEVGSFWKITPDVEAGLINTAAQRKAVGYVNDPLDTGGETKFGVAQNPNPDVVVRTLTWAQAKDVYFRKYWLLGRCDRFSPRLAVLHFDGCVNHGVGRANKMLQDALNLPADGIIGPQTLGSANSADQIALCHRICDIREEFYRAIVRRKPNQERFLRGWLRRIKEMRDFTTDVDEDFL